MMKLKTPLRKHKQSHNLNQQFKPHLEDQQEPLPQLTDSAPYSKKAIFSAGSETPRTNRALPQYSTPIQTKQ